MKTHQSHSSTGLLGNDKPEVLPKKDAVVDIRARGWFLTVWNYTGNILNTLNTLNCKKMIANETAPTTGKQHYHVYLYGRNAFKWSFLCSLFPDSKIEVAKGAPKHNLKYLSKQNLVHNDWPDLIVERPIYKGDDLPLYENLFDWQKNILDIIDTKPDDRTVYWFYEPNGCSGKSKFGKYLCFHNPQVCLLTATKSADILTAVDTQYNTYIFDFPRTLGQDYCPYTAIEQVKNGFITDSKLKKQARIVCFDPPHIFCFSNYAPDVSKLSKDRWNIYNIYLGVWEY